VWAGGGMHLEAGFDWSVICRLLATKRRFRDVRSYVGFQGVKQTRYAQAEVFRIWTRSRPRLARNSAVRRPPDLILANPICCALG